MTLIINTEQARYIDDDFVCAEFRTPSEILAQLKELDDEYFETMKEHLITFTN